MDIQPLLYATPIAAYVVVRRRRGEGWSETGAALGLPLRSGSSYPLAAGLALPLSILGARVVQQLPADLLQQEGLEVSRYLDRNLSIGVVAVVLARESVLIALGEELFFRGLVAGALFRRFGFALGNAAQSAFFILPHLVLLRISSALWPVVDVQLVGAWLFGWLRWRSGSIWPGWLLHTSLNTAAAVTVIATD